MSEKLINLLTLQSIGVLDSLKIKAFSLLIDYVDIPVYLAIYFYQVTTGTTAGLFELGISMTTQVYNEGRKIAIINTVLSKATDLKDVILEMV